MNRAFIASLLLSAVATISACTTAPTSQAGRQALTAESQATVSAFTSADSSLRELLDKSIGYAVFPDVGKAGFIAGGAYGKGEVYERGQLIGYADIAQGTLGLQAGAQSFDELILFLDQSQLDKFRANQFAFSANLSAVVLQAGAAGAADHSKGVVVFVKPRGGLMAEASVGGQQFTFRTVSDAERTQASRTQTSSSSN
jgi:lipid-binding SYLF domain-containing protein